MYVWVGFDCFGLRPPRIRSLPSHNGAANAITHIQTEVASHNYAQIILVERVDDERNLGTTLRMLCLIDNSIPQKDILRHARRRIQERQ